MKTPHEKREIRAEARGGWSGGPVKDNPGVRRVAWVVFWLALAGAVAAVVGILGEIL